MQLDLPETGKSISLNRFVHMLGLSSKMSLVPAHDQLLKLTILPKFSCYIFPIVLLVHCCKNVILNFASKHSLAFELFCTIFKFYINGSFNGYITI